jgi:hypothetical protein
LPALSLMLTSQPARTSIAVQLAWSHTQAS